MHSPNESKSVHGYLPAAPFDLLASVEAPALAFVVGFDTLGVDEEIRGGRFFPFFFLACLLSSSIISSQMPRC